MSRFHSYISSASAIIDRYDGNGPFTHHLRNFFSTQKKYGSRDRKSIASLCYGYFRVAHAFSNVAKDEKLIIGLFLCSDMSNEMLRSLRPGWDDRVSLPVSEKFSFLHAHPAGIIPFSHQLSEHIDKDLFAISFLQQPCLYLRIRPGKKKQVIDKLNNAGIAFDLITEDCLMLENKTAVDTVLILNKEVLIQDFNSQKVLDFLKNTPAGLPAEVKTDAWDSCAASGGKSILLYDILGGNVRITVSDIRENILVNLAKRLGEAGININKKFTADLSKTSGLSPETVFPIIICDAPCTGSGTWARTPEQLFYFDEGSIDGYAEKQKKIVSNILVHLKTGGLFFYITCSVFKKENEEIVDWINKKFQLRLIQMDYLIGFDKKADNMFVAVFVHDEAKA